MSVCKEDKITYIALGFPHCNITASTKKAARTFQKPIKGLEMGFTGIIVAD
jgi:hypothetical protein